MRRVTYLIISLLALPPVILADWSGTVAAKTLKPPRANDVVAFANDVLIRYSTDEMRWVIPRERILTFLRKGELRPYNADESQELSKLASFTPPAKLTAVERTFVERWHQETGGDERRWPEISRLYSHALGTFCTKQHEIYYWCLINDRVLLLRREGEQCYLVLQQ
jgi:hypothetical protein